MAKQKPLVILDRDGVINQDSDKFIKSESEWLAIQGSIEAIIRLKEAGYLVAVATNQSGIYRQLYSLTTLAQMHNKLNRIAALLGETVDAIFLCPHGPADHCQCRKPLPGLLLKIGRTFNHDLQDSFLVGDTLRDLEAAEAVGIKPLLVRTGKGERTISSLTGQKQYPTYDDLANAVDAILAQEV